MNKLILIINLIVFLPGCGTWMGNPFNTSPKAKDLNAKVYIDPVTTSLLNSFEICLERIQFLEHQTVGEQVYYEGRFLELKQNEPIFLFETFTEKKIFPILKFRLKSDCDSSLTARAKKGEETLSTSKEDIRISFTLSNSGFEIDPDAQEIYYRVSLEIDDPTIEALSQDSEFEDFVSNLTGSFTVIESFSYENEDPHENVSETPRFEVEEQSPEGTAETTHSPPGM